MNTYLITVQEGLSPEDHVGTGQGHEGGLGGERKGVIIPLKLKG